MKNRKNTFLMPKLLLAIFVLSGMVVFAATNETVSRALDIARPDVKIQIAGSVNRDSKSLALDKVDQVKSGEILDWNITSSNEGVGDAKNFRVIGQIPQGSTFVAGSAQGENQPQVSYSIDGGQNFSAQPTVDETQADGSVKKVAAPASKYTQLKFEWASPLASQNKLNAAYQVRVK